MWGSGASGAMVEDTIPLVAYYRDSVGNPIGSVLPLARWSSSNSAILQVVADSIAVALDTGAVVLTAITDSIAADTVDVNFTVVPRWHGRLVWIRNTAELGTFAMATREYPGHEIYQFPPLGHPRGSYGNPFLSSDGARLAVQAERDLGGFSPGPSTVVIIDMMSRVPVMPLGDLSGYQLDPAFLAGDTMLAFMSAAPGGWEIFTMRPDGSQIEQRTRLGQREPPFFDVTPQGTVIMPIGYRSAGNLYEMTLAGDTVRQLTATADSEEGDPAVSPDGTLIAYSRGSHVWVMNRDGSNARRLLPDRRVLSGWPPGFGSHLAGANSPSWSPDSRFVILEWSMDADLHPTDGYYNSLGEIYAIRVTDGLAIRLTRNPHVDAQPFFR